MAWLIELSAKETSLFFSVSKIPDSRFDNRVQHLGLWINFDAGWHVDKNSLRKGYSSNCCEIRLNTQGATIEHSQPRSFPIWFKHGFITNLHSTLGTKSCVKDHFHMNPDGTVVCDSMDIDLTVPSNTITVDQAVENICRYLDSETKQLGNQPVKLFCTGGLDTILLYALLKYHGANFEILEQEHFEPNRFHALNQTALEYYWSYRKKLLHNYNSPMWLATGACGDEYFLRGPPIIAMLTAWHDIDFGEILKTSTTQYHYYHFGKYQDLWAKSWQDRGQLKHKYPTKHELNAHVMDYLANDHQHWHLEQVITWTPFKNIEILKTLLQCDIQDLMPQFLHGEISRKIIARYCPEVLEFVSAFKNYNNKEKLSAFLHWHGSKTTS